LDRSAFESIVDEVLYIYIAGNDIRIIPDNLFSDLTFIEGSYLMLSLVDNNIETVGKDAFRNLQNVYGISLSDNRISELPDYLFANSTVQNINLSSNNLSNLNATTFYDVPQLFDLYISLNPLNDEKTIRDIEYEINQSSPNVQIYY
jgi:Leucine-rich repeat (LRR) protein